MLASLRLRAAGRDNTHSRERRAAPATGSARLILFRPEPTEARLGVRGPRGAGGCTEKRLEERESKEKAMEEKVFLSREGTQREAGSPNVPWPSPRRLTLPARRQRSAQRELL